MRPIWTARSASHQAELTDRRKGIAATSNKGRAASKPHVHLLLSLAHVHPATMLAAGCRTAETRASAARVGGGNTDHQHVEQTPRPVP
jgi:hypothetical protein